LGFARLVTHYWAHNAWLDDGVLLRDAENLGDVPGILIHGRLDIGTPLESAWRLRSAWPGSELLVVDRAGHGAGQTDMSSAILAATSRLLPA
jgi:proline iminopeptidase